MAEEVNSLILEQLRHIRKGIGNIEANEADLKLRVSAVEGHLGQVQVQLAGMNSRLDRIDERSNRVERRLDLIDA